MTTTVSKRVIPITSVIAITPSFGIGQSNTVPWAAANVYLPRDLQYFRHATTKTNCNDKVNVVVMGRKTWESIPIANRPLKNRINFIISKQFQEEGIDRLLATLPSPVSVVDSSSGASSLPRVYLANSLQHVIDTIHQCPILNRIVEKIVIVGGVQLFDESYFHPWFETLHLTEVINRDFPCDTFLTDKMITDLKIQQHQGQEDESTRMKRNVVEELIEENSVEYRIVEYKNKHFSL